MAPRATVPHKDIRRFDRPDANERDFLKGRYFPAACPSYVAARDLVRVSGPAILGVRQVDIANPFDLSRMPAVGMVVDKPTATTCLVQIHGEINGGLMAGLIPNARYYVGSNARITDVPPAPGPGETVWLQLVGVALGSTILLITPDFQLVERQDGAIDPIRADADVVPATVPADTDLRGAINLDASLLNYAGLDFKTRVIVQVNGVTLRNGASSLDGHDCYPGSNPALGDIKLSFPLRGGSRPDRVSMMVVRDRGFLAL